MMIIKMMVDMRFAQARSAEAWRKGDLAVCLTSEWQFPCDADPARDQLLRVDRVYDYHGMVALSFEGKPHDHCWIAAGFRKALKDQATKENLAWVTQLKRRSERPFVTDEQIEWPR